MELQTVASHSLPPLPERVNTNVGDVVNNGSMEGLNPGASRGAANELWCAICDTPWGSKGSLLTHQRSHGMYYRCIQCPSEATDAKTGFPTKKALLRHFGKTHRGLPKKDIMEYVQICYKEMGRRTTEARNPEAEPSNALVPVAMHGTFTQPSPSNVRELQQARPTTMTQVTNDKEVITVIDQLKTELGTQFSTRFDKLEQFLQPFQPWENAELHNLRRQNKEYEKNWNLLQNENTTLKSALQFKISGDMALKLIEKEKTIAMLKLRIDQLKQRQIAFLLTRQEDMRKHEELLTTLQKAWKRATTLILDYERQLGEAQVKNQVLEQYLERARTRCKRKDDLNLSLEQDLQNKKMKFGQEGGHMDIKNEPGGEETVEIKTESTEPKCEGNMNVGVGISRGQVEEGQVTTDAHHYYSSISSND